MTVMRDDEAPARRCLALGLVAGAVAAHAGAWVGLLADVEPFSGWFYNFAWWSWIAFAGGWTHLRGASSLVVDRTRELALLLPWSTAFWLVFEAFNLRLDNWYYAGVPPGFVPRYLGMSLAFATVLPGLCVTCELLGSFGLGRRRRERGWRPSGRALRAMIALGVAFLLLPLAWPRWFFPLTWGWLVLLVEPWLYRRGAPGLLTRIARGEAGVVLRVLAAGAVCGILWEAWNWNAGSKWHYTVPFVGEARLFEMPLAGFLGFPPFALEAYTFVALLRALGLLPRSRGDARFAPRLVAATVALALLLPSLARLQDRTVRSTTPLVEDLDPLAAPVRAALEARGIRRASELLRADARDPGLLARLGASGESAERAIASARLRLVASLGPRGEAWLEGAGVESVASLAAADPDELHRAIAERGRGAPPRPSPGEVAIWVRRARETLDRSALRSEP